MHSALSQHQSMEIHREENLIERIGEIHREISNDSDRGHDLRDLLAYLIDAAHGEPCFSASAAMASRIGPQSLSCANLLSANILDAEQNGGGKEELLNYAITRIFALSYEEPKNKDFNQMAGILASLSSLAHPGMIELLGMLSICSHELAHRRSKS